MRKELLSKKEVRSNDLGNYSWPIKIAKDAKLKRFPVKKACSGQKKQRPNTNFVTSLEGSKAKTIKSKKGLGEN